MECHYIRLSGVFFALLLHPQWLSGRSKFSKYLTSKQLKVKLKSNNIAGLQLADLLAYPSYKATLARHNDEKLPENFGGKIARILEESKYSRNSRGQIRGWGQKWLP